MSSTGEVPSAAACAASAGLAPAASACSVAAARSGVSPMLARPTRPPTVATPTIAQSLARRVNFSYAQPVPALRGTRISTSSSSSATAVSK